VPAKVEALVCEMRRAHPRWGARRITFELGQAGVPSPPSRATVHRILVRNGLVRAQRQQHRRKYRRWQREAPMHLWQLDLVGGVFLADGRECKMLTGIDDHSRFVVVAAVLAVPSARAVADAFLKAMRVYGVPSEVLTDNGKQFTARLTKPYSPTTTGKIERWHQTLRRELLDPAVPFVDLPSAQAAISAWVHTYNHAQPHQLLDMATRRACFGPTPNQNPWCSQPSYTTPRGNTKQPKRSRQPPRRKPAAPTVGWWCCRRPVRSSSRPSSLPAEPSQSSPRCSGSRSAPTAAGNARTSGSTSTPSTSSSTAR
jgi:transposase InsO family protein